jgi:hypothetical protein
MSSGDLLVTLDKSCRVWLFKLCSCCLLCVGVEVLPLSGDADEGCQWKVQTEEGWTLYWDPQA